tara:strand:+ start:34 stop:225 length:192 start_codon:yes stop_codon:yes gene_type:complete
MPYRYWKDGQPKGPIRQKEQEAERDAISDGAAEYRGDIFFPDDGVVIASVDIDEETDPQDGMS